MKNFRVKLIDGNKATKDENVKGFLGDATVETPMPMAYSRGEAIKKAKMFGGKIDEIKNVINIEELKLAKVNGIDLTLKIKLELAKINPQFRDTDLTLLERIFSADVFFDILKKNKKRLNDKSIEQLEVLAENMWSFDYVLVANV